MADLQFVDFAFMAGHERKENQFRLLEVFSSIDVNYSLTDKAFRVRFSRVFAQHGPTAVRPSAIFFTRGRSKKFQHFYSQRWKSSLTIASRCNVNGKISDGIKGFFGLIKASILWTKYC